LAGSTGLEPAASAVTGQRSNQLNYDPTWNFELRTYFRLATSDLLFDLGGAGFEPATAGV
jgi:hypothetical protein